MPLIVGVPLEETILLGAFQRRCEIGPVDRPLRRRLSGGAAARVGPGVVVVHLDAADLPGEKVLNRHVRPLLRALTKVAGRPVSYFGRDWIACAGRPVGMVAFAHEAETQRSLFEAFVSVRASVWLGERASHRGKETAILDVDPERAALAIAAAYGGEVASVDVPTTDVADEPPWEVTREEEIGILGAGHDARGALRVGGELMASRDALAALEQAIADPRADVDAAIEQTVGAAGAVTFGVRLSSIRDVLLELRQLRRS